jgi:chromosomal replication initiator protein
MPPDVAALVKDAANAFCVEEAALFGSCRTRTVAQARHALVYAMAQRRPRLSLVEIGAMVGGRDHSTVINSIRAAELLAIDDPEYALRLTGLLPAAPAQRKPDE